MVARKKDEISDFGEKIGGARKDLYEDDFNLDDIKEFSHRELLDSCIKKNLWKKPDYEKMVERGVSKEVTYFYKLAYDSFPTKINSKNNVEQDRSLAKKYIELSKDLSKVEIRSYEDIRNLGNILSQKGYTTDLKYRINPRTDILALEKFRKNINSIESNYNRSIVQRKIEEKNFPYKQEAWKRGIAIREGRFSLYKGIKMDSSITQYEVVKKSGNLNTSFGLYPTKEKAEEFINTTIKELYENKKNKEKEEIEPRSQLAFIKRKGIDYRNGNNVTTDIFQETFKFRGGEFGNWNTYDDRQQNLNLSYDSLIDLSRVLKVSPTAISFDGRLALAFGSRGRGGKNSALAHYEPTLAVINLTKMRGAGSLAHEWGHAFDDYLGIKSETTQGANQLFSESYIKIKESKIPVEAEIFKELVGNLKTRLMKDEEINIYYKELLTENKKNLLTTTSKLISSEIPEFNKGDIEGKYAYFFNENNSSKDFKNNMSRLIDDIKTDYNKMVSVDKSPNINRKLYDIEKNETGLTNYKDEVGVKKCETDFYKNAKELDKYRSKDYFQKNSELFARAFETHVEFKLKELELKSDYLVYGTDTGNIMYPPKEEVILFSKNFDKLFESINVLDKNNLISDNYKILENSYENKDYKDVGKDSRNIEDDHKTKEPIQNIKKVDKQINNNADLIFRYYLPQRPPSIGTQPGIPNNIKAFDNKENGVWGYVEYRKQLTDSQIKDYELIDSATYEYKQFEKECNKIEMIKNEKIRDMEDLLDEGDLFKFEQKVEFGQLMIIGQNCANVIHPEKDFVVAKLFDYGNGYDRNDIQDSVRMSKSEFANYLIENKFEIQNCVDNKYISKCEGKEKGQEVSVIELQKIGKLRVLSIPNDKMDNLKNMQHNYSLNKYDTKCNVIVLEKHYDVARSDLKLKEKEIGNISYCELKKSSHLELSYLKINSEDLVKIEQLGIKYTAFIKENDVLNVVGNKSDIDRVKEVVKEVDSVKLVISVKDLEKTLNTVGKNYDKQYGNITYRSLKSLGNTDYMVVDKLVADKVVNELKNICAFDKGNGKVNLAFLKSEKPKIEEIKKNINKTNINKTIDK